LAVGPRDLLARRERLTRGLAERQWDLGGATYEMATRDHFRLDVLVRQSAELQEIDAELGEVERLARLEEAGAAGFCPRCDGLYGRGAGFCWRCGYELVEAVTPSALDGAGGGGSGPEAPDSPRVESDQNLPGSSDGALEPGQPATGSTPERADHGGARDNGPPPQVEGSRPLALAEGAESGREHGGEPAEEGPTAPSAANARG